MIKTPFTLAKKICSLYRFPFLIVISGRIPWIPKSHKYLLKYFAFQRRLTTVHDFKMK